MTSEQLDDYYTKMMKLNPTNFKVSDLPMQFSNQSTILTKDKKSKSVEVPEDMMFPIESDEVQAILIEWSYITKKKGSNQYAEAIFNGIGITYSSFNDYTLVQTVNTPDVAMASSAAKLYGKLADAIQKHAQVWIDTYGIPKIAPL